MGGFCARICPLFFNGAVFLFDIKPFFHPSFLPWRPHEDGERAQIDCLERIASSSKSKYLHDLWWERESKSLEPRSFNGVNGRLGKGSRLSMLTSWRREGCPTSCRIALSVLGVIIRCMKCELDEIRLRHNIIATNPFFSLRSGCWLRLVYPTRQFAVLHGIQIRLGWVSPLPSIKQFASLSSPVSQNRKHEVQRHYWRVDVNLRQLAFFQFIRTLWRLVTLPLDVFVWRDISFFLYSTNFAMFLYPLRYISKPIFFLKAIKMMPWP